MASVRSSVLSAAICFSLVATGPLEAESFSRGWKRITHQAKVNGTHLGRRLGRDIRNTFRFFSEQGCDRVKRKKGKDSEAYKRCMRQSGATAGPPPQFYAAVEVDCWKPGRDTRWGTVELKVWSMISKRDAQRTITDQTSLGDVCRTMHHDQNLTDGLWRWTA